MGAARKARIRPLGHHHRCECRLSRLDHIEEPHFYMGFILRKHRKLMEARAEYESVLRINSTNFEAHGNLGLIFLEQRNLEQAEVQFQSALRINADDAIARKNLDAVLKARAAAKKPE